MLSQIKLNIKKLRKIQNSVVSHLGYQPSLKITNGYHGSTIQDRNSQLNNTKFSVNILLEHVVSNLVCWSLS